MKVDRQLFLLATTSLVVLMLGTYGFYQNDENTDVLTAIYLALQLFSMESGVVEGPTPISIEVSRWLALGTLIAVIYTTISALFAHFRTSINISFFKDHVIVCGAGKRGEALVRGFLKTSTSKVVIIELDDNAASLGELRNLGVEVVIGNAIDAAVLQKAGISRARTLIAVTGDDEKNLAICFEVHNKINAVCELSAGIESWSWRNYFLDRVKSNIRLDSYTSRSSRAVIFDLANQAVKSSRFRNNGLRILLEINDNKRQEFLRAAITIFQIAGDKKPIIDLTCVGEGEEKAFRDRFPSADLVADLRWHHDTASNVFPEGGSECPDFAMFALGTDIETLEASERFWMRHEVPSDRIVACLLGDTDATQINNVRKDDKDFSIINLLEHGLGSKHPLEPNIEYAAKICHAIYYKNEKIKNPNYGNNVEDYPQHWSDLSERAKESNRLAAMHHQIKRSAWQSREQDSAIDLLIHLSRCEHMRWMAEKAMDGWRWSGSHEKNTRDNKKLKHHLLIPYDSLDRPEKDKDYNSFLWTLDISDEELDQIDLTAESKELAKIGNFNKFSA